MSAEYIFRMDDITPGMDWGRFSALIQLFQSHGVKPLLGVVPDNQDPALNIEPANPRFWDELRELVSADQVDLAQHGYQHVLTRRPGAGILNKQLGIKDESEFAGEPYITQLAKVRKGRELLTANGLNTDYWMAPNHSFDFNTLRALRNSGFTAVTDGVALFPFRSEGLTFVPQQTWQPRWIPCGVQTICIHANHITPSDVRKLRVFLRRPLNFTRFSEVVANYSRGPIQQIADISFRAAYGGAKYIKRNYTA
jgi:predicted deacetylase